MKGMSTVEPRGYHLSRNGSVRAIVRRRVSLMKLVEDPAVAARLKAMRPEPRPDEVKALAEDPAVKEALYLVPRGETPRSRSASRASRMHFSRPGSRVAHAEMQRKLWAEPDHHAKMVTKRRATAQSPEWRAKMEKVWRSPEARKKKSAAAKARTDAAYRARLSEQGKARWANPEYCAIRLVTLAQARAAKAKKAGRA